MVYDPGDGRYDKACLSAYIECLNYHPTGNCTHPRWIRLRTDGLEWQAGEIMTALRRLTHLPQKTKDGSGDVKVPLTWAMVTQLAKLMEEHGYGWVPDPGLNRWIYDEFMRRHDEGSDLKFDLGSLDWTPMPHQVAGAYVGALNKRFFFCDDMRTGKTRTALLTLAELEARGEDPFPVLVVCPASVMDSWMEELEAAFPGWPAVQYAGTKRKNLSSRYKIYVTSWNTFTRDMKHEQTELPPLVKFMVPKTVVMDEAHALCNVKTKQSVAAGQIGRVADYALLMSGTPITRDVGGFWRSVGVLDTRSFPDPDRYKDRYTDRFHSDYGEDTIEGMNKATLEEFHVLMKGAMRRIAKRDVNADLPPVSYSTRVVQIPPAHRAAYDEMAADMLAHIPDTDEPLEVMTTLAQLQRLTQLASSACDVEIVMVLEERVNHPMFGQYVPKQHVTMREPSWKIDELMQMMDENQGTGNPLITFSPHTQLIKLAGARAEGLGYRVGYITGLESKKQKTAYRHAFQDGELDLMCCNITAGGVGLTLNRGDHVTFIERSWAYWQNHQAEARADDIINAKQVHVTDIVAASTVESRVRVALKDKARQLSELVRDPRIVEELLGGQPLHVK
jgi:SNF2 family DNA or RNA helicase